MSDSHDNTTYFKPLYAIGVSSCIIQMWLTFNLIIRGRHMFKFAKPSTYLAHALESVLFAYWDYVSFYAVY